MSLHIIIFTYAQIKKLIPTVRIYKNGYIIYKSEEHNCSRCPFKAQCHKVNVNKS